MLRRLTKVPDNFGDGAIDEFGDPDSNAIDYKREVEGLEKDVEMLQEQRAELEKKVRMYRSLYSNKEGERYKNLTSEQFKLLDEYAINLAMGRQEIPKTDESRKLTLENERLKAQIQYLEDQMFNNNQDLINQISHKIDELRHTGGGQGQLDIIGALDNHKAHMENIVRNNAGDHMASLVGHTGLGVEESLLKPSKAMQNGKYYPPPQPIPGMFGDYNDCNSGQSHRFGTKMPVKGLEDQMGADMDLETARFYMAALQLHNLENMEIIGRREEEIQALNVEVQEVKVRLRKCLALQDELFINHHKQRQDFDNKAKELTELNTTLSTTNAELNKRVELFEGTIGAIRSGDPQRMENQLDEVTKRATIAETNVVRLSRKYQALLEENEDLLEKWRALDANQSKREYELIERLEVLHSWKEEATQQITVLLDRARNSVSLEDHRAVKGELELSQEKYANLKMREAELIAKISKREGLEREIDDYERKMREMQDDLSSAEIEIEVLQTRLTMVDPLYKKYYTVFSRMTQVMKQKNISPMQTFELFDKDGDQTLSREELMQAFTAMGISVNSNESEVLFMFIDLDGSGSIDYKEFIKKLKRSGVAVRSKEEEVVNTIWEKITSVGLTLNNAFKIFDKDGNNLIEYEDMAGAFKTLNIKVDDSYLSELFKLIDITGDGKITNAEFVHIFKRFNKVSYERSEDTKVDWKFELMAKVEKVAKTRDLSLEEVFNKIDRDGDGQVTLQELNELFKEMSISLERNQFEKLFYAIDTNKSGFMSYSEFLAYINRARKEVERVYRARLILSKKNQALSSNNLTHSDLDLTSDPSTRYQLKVALLEGKEKSARHELEKMNMSLAQMQEQLQREENRVRSLEESQARTKSEYFKEKEERTRLEGRYQSGVSREMANRLKIDNEDYKIKIAQLRGAINTFRGLHDAAVNEAKSLRLSIGRDKDEISKLREAIHNIQGESDDKALVGKLYKANLNSKWAEANQNQRYDMVLDELRKLRIENKDLHAKISGREKELFEVQAIFSERLMVLEGQLKDARMSLLPTVSISRIEELAMSVRRLADSKLDLELSNKKIREENYELSVKVDHFLLREKNLQELQRMLNEEHPEELSQRVIEISEKMTDLRLQELKAQRELYLIKEKEEYYARINRTQVDHIKKLEEELSKFEFKMNEREDFWRKRYNDQLKVAFNQQEGGDPNLQKEMSDTYIETELNRGMTQMEKKTGLLSKLDSQIMRADTVSTNFGKAKEYKELVAELKEQVRILKEENRFKERKIKKLSDTNNANNYTNNYTTDNIDKLAFGELEEETKAMANAAQQTIITLQGLLDEKDNEIEKLERDMATMKADRLDQVKQIRTQELAIQNHERNDLINERGRINLEHMTSVKVLERLSSMNHKEMEKLIMDYENKIRILTEEMTESEKNNVELVKKLTEERMGRKLAENKGGSAEQEETQVEILKKELLNAKKFSRKKQMQLDQYKGLYDELKVDLAKRDAELVQANKTTFEKLEANKGQSGETEMRLGALTKKYKELNQKQKNALDQIRELKTQESNSNALTAELKREITELKVENSKLKTASRNGGRKLKRKPTEENVESKEENSKSTRRPASGINKKTADPKNPPAFKRTAKQIERDEREVEKLKTRIDQLEKENTELRGKIEAEFIDKDTGVLISTGGGSFTDFSSMVRTIRLYLKLNPGINIYPIMKQSDTRNLGIAMKEDFLKDLASSGIKFGRSDNRKFAEWLPKDKLGNIDYHEFYLILTNKAEANIQSEDTSNSSTRGGGITGRKPKAPRNEGYGATMARSTKRSSQAGRDLRNANQNIVEEERNIEILKRRLADKKKEIQKLSAQVQTWKEKALKYEEDWKAQGNKTRSNNVRPITSQVDPNVPNQDTALRMIKDLEGEISEAKRLLTYEKETRDTNIRYLEADLHKMSQENTILSSEIDALRKQLEKIFSERLTKNQLSEEKEKERELLLSSLMTKLEKLRRRENELVVKLQVIEKENIELKYIKEGIDTRMEAINRRNRELESSMKPYL